MKAPGQSSMARATRFGIGGSRSCQKGLTMFAGIDYFATLQSAVAGLLITYSPEFLLFSRRMFLALATLKIAHLGYQFWFKGGAHHDPEWLIAKTLAQIAIVYSLVTFYAAPMPLFGISFSHLITDNMARFA